MVITFLFLYDSKHRKRPGSPLQQVTSKFLRTHAAVQLNNLQQRFESFFLRFTLPAYVLQDTAPLMASPPTGCTFLDRHNHIISELSLLCAQTLWYSTPPEFPSRLHSPHDLFRTSGLTFPIKKALTTSAQLPIYQINPILSYAQHKDSSYFRYLQSLFHTYQMTVRLLLQLQDCIVYQRMIETNLMHLQNMRLWNDDNPMFPLKLDFAHLYSNFFFLHRNLNIISRCIRIHYQIYYTQWLRFIRKIPCRTIINIAS